MKKQAGNRPTTKSKNKKNQSAPTRVDLLSRISVNPRVCSGKPCIKGHRIWVSLILDFLASGTTIEELMAEYNLPKEDILACIAYGAEMARERFVDVETTA